MPSNTPSLRQIMALACPYCGHILTPSEQEDDYYYCEQCGYRIPTVAPEPLKTSEDAPGSPEPL